MKVAAALIFLLFLLTGPSFAQADTSAVDTYQPMIEQGKSWTIADLVIITHPTPFTYLDTSFVVKTTQFIEGDTLLDGYKYQLVKQVVDTAQMDTTTMIAVREENRIITTRRLQFNPKIDTLYNFNLEVGAVLFEGFLTTGVDLAIFVSKIDTITTLDGISRRRFDISYQRRNIPDQEPIILKTWIEGIGDPIRGLFSISCIFTLNRNCGDRLLCVQKDGQTLLETNYGNACELSRPQQEWFPIGAEWYYTIGSSSGNNLGVYHIGKDTIIGGRNAKIFAAKNYLNVAEDGEKVYRYIPERAEWYLLYDFTAQAGDTLEMYAFFDQFFRIVIDSVTQIELAGDTFLAQHTSVLDKFDVGWGGRNIQYLGNDAFLIPTLGLGPSFNLRCYVPSQNQIYSLVPFACDLVPVEDITSIQQKIKVFPNPTSNLLNIDIPDFLIKESEISIYNLRGQLVKQYSNNEPSISVADLHAGLYFLLLKTTEGASYSTRFLKQ